MGKKIKANITIDEDIWTLLPKYISESRSSWFEKQARKQINCNDASTSCLRKVQTTSRKEKIGD